MNVESLKGTIALPKSVVCRALCAALGMLSQATSGWVPPTVVVVVVAWFTGQTLTYSISGFVPESVYPSVVQSQPPCAEGQTARMLSADVEVDDLSQTMVPSQSWRWPSPSDGSSLGKYLCLAR